MSQLESTVPETGVRSGAVENVAAAPSHVGEWAASGPLHGRSAGPLPSMGSPETPFPHAALSAGPGVITGPVERMIPGVPALMILSVQQSPTIRNAPTQPRLEPEENPADPLKGPSLPGFSPFAGDPFHSNPSALRGPISLLSVP